MYVYEYSHVPISTLEKSENFNKVPYNWHAYKAK